jgi:isopenicillin-N epimerase
MTWTTPPLGRAVRDEWILDWSWLHVNHGSFGAAPRAILEIQQDWRRRMEAQPSRFVLRVLPEALRAQAETLGAFIGAQGKDIAFVENATTGCNAVLRSLPLAAGGSRMATRRCATRSAMSPSGPVHG